MTAEQFADPVPQSLILTAIVIGFGVLAFSLVLAHRVHQSTGSDDIDTIGSDPHGAVGQAGSRVMLLALPIVLPLATAIALHLLPQRSRLLRVVAFLGALLLLAAGVSVLVRVQDAGIQVLQVGSWPAPFGITLVADLFSALMVVMTGDRRRRGDRLIVRRRRSATRRAWLPPADTRAADGRRQARS